VSDTQQDPEHVAQETALSLRRLATVALGFCLCAALSYALPGSQRLRPWVPGEGMPVVRMFEDGAESLPEFAEAGAQSNQSASQLADQLGERIAQNLGGGDDGVGHDGRDGEEAHGGQERDAGKGDRAGTRARIDPGEYAGIAQHIEHPEALRAFFKQLAAVARREPSAIARVAHYGDSAVAADAVTSTARRRLQQRFGDAGHGFVLASGPMHYLHRDVVQHASDGWEVNSIVQLGLSPGLYGYGGVQAHGGAGERAYFATVKDGEIGTAVSSFELFYQRCRGCGALDVRLDGTRQALLKTRSDHSEDAFYKLDVPDGPHSLALKAIGSPSRLYGVALERDGPGVVYDSLGIVGAVAQRLLGADPDHIAAQIAHRDPDMLVLAFGGNESANDWLNLEDYEHDLTRVVQQMRRGKPSMSCMLFGPLDQGERDKRGRVVTVKVLPKIVAVQRRVSAQQGCAFFDSFAAMGGEGAMGEWTKVHPRLATSDLRHATPAGYEVIGNMYYKALLEGFAAFLRAGAGG